MPTDLDKIEMHLGDIASSLRELVALNKKDVEVAEVREARMVKKDALLNSVLGSIVSTAAAIYGIKLPTDVLSQLGVEASEPEPDHDNMMEGADEKCFCGDARILHVQGEGTCLSCECQMFTPPVPPVLEGP